jgi:hypothetical protein
LHFSATLLREKIGELVQALTGGHLVAIGDGVAARSTFLVAARRHSIPEIASQFHAFFGHQEQALQGRRAAGPALIAWRLLGGKLSAFGCVPPVRSTTDAAQILRHAVFATAVTQAASPKGNTGDFVAIGAIAVVLTLDGRALDFSALRTHQLLAVKGATGALEFRVRCVLTNVHPAHRSGRTRKRVDRLASRGCQHFAETV